MEKLNVYQKLNKVQVSLNAPKNQYNSFGKYSYRSCEDILEGLKPLLKEVGACVVIEDEIVVIGDKTVVAVEDKNGTTNTYVSNVFVKATASFIDTETGEKVSSSALARHEETKKGMDSAQVTGSTSSYARKYALNGLFCIDDNKDADTEVYQSTSKVAQSSSQLKVQPTSKPTAKVQVAQPKKAVSQAQFVEEEDEDCPF